MATVQTYQGSVEVTNLGPTLIHEHVFVRSFELEVNDPDPEWRPAEGVETAVRGLEALYELGIRTVVDLTVLSPRGGELLRQMPARSPPDLSRMLLSPMPGLLVSVAVSEGEEVKVGQELAVVEAMKMENVLRAERDGRVARVHVAAGASLTVDQTILEFE